MRDSAKVRGCLPTIDAPCALCRGEGAEPVWNSPDRALSREPTLCPVSRLRVPVSASAGTKSASGGLLSRPLSAPSGAVAPGFAQGLDRARPRRAVRSRERAGYTDFHDDNVGVIARAARVLIRRLRWSCPPWTGAGRYLDVGCGSGAGLGAARSFGWHVSGIEVDAAAAQKARRFAKPRYYLRSAEARLGKDVAADESGGPREARRAGC